MPRPLWLLAVAAGGCAGDGEASAPRARGGETAAEASLTRALAFLSREVPRWPAENACFSCHHNGDAARALFTARRLGREVPRQALSSTERWLLRPDRWDDQKGDPAFSDKALARYQFAAALAAGAGADLLRDRRAMEAAGDLVAALQGPDGSFIIEALLYSAGVSGPPGRP